MRRIIVLGAGYAGLAAATSLAGRARKRDDVHVTVVNASERFTERLRPHQTASGQRLADLRIMDLLAGTGVEFLRGWVTGVDAARRTVRVSATWSWTMRISTAQGGYEPATWSKMIDIDRSSEANAIEHVLEEAIASVPVTVLHLRNTFSDG